MEGKLSTRIKDAGIAIRHLRGRVLFYIARLVDGLEVGGAWQRRYAYQINKKRIPNHQQGVHSKVQNPEIGLPITPHPFRSAHIPFLANPPPIFAIFGCASSQILKKKMRALAP